MEIQINRLTDLISTRNAEEIGLLLDAELAEKELARYLAELPPEYGAVTSEIVTRPSHPEGLFEIVLITQQGSRFSALTGWQEQEGRLKLTFFALTPPTNSKCPEICGNHSKPSSLGCGPLSERVIEKDSRNC